MQNLPTHPAARTSPAEIAADLGVDIDIVRAVEARLQERPRAYTTAAFAAKTSRTERAVREDCRRGLIKAVWTGRRWIIPHDELETYLSSVLYDDRGRPVVLTRFRVSTKETDR